MHILIIPSEEFIPTNSPLSAVFQHDQAIALQERGIKVGVISVTRPIAIKSGLITLFRKLTGRRTFYKVLEGKSLFNVIGTLTYQLFIKKTAYWQIIDGVKVLRIQCRCWSDIQPYQELEYFKTCVRNGIKIYRNKLGSPNIVHAHNAWFAGIAAMELKEQDKLPYCITEHSTFYSRNLIPITFYPLIKKSFEKSSKNIVVSPMLGKLLESRGLLTNNYIYIPNILNQAFHKIDLQTIQKNNVFTFLNIAELTKKKGQVILLEAFARSFAGNKRVQLVIGGTGDLVIELKELSERLFISEQVAFTGLLSREQVKLQMLGCDVFVLPSLHETFGVVLIEAMACGKPVIATKSGGPESIVHSGNGILVDPGDINQLATCMSSLYKGGIVFDAFAIRNEALLNYGSVAVSKHLIQVYSEIIKSSNLNHNLK